jgi:hypothetical protein
MNHNFVALIHQDTAYKKMTSDDVLGRIMNHGMNIQEANNIKNHYKGVSTSKKQDIFLKAKKSRKKKVLIESPTEEEEEEEEEEEDVKENMMKMKFLYSSRNSTSSSRREDLTRGKEKRSQGQRGCATITVRMSTSLPNEHIRGRKKTMTRERSLTKSTRKIKIH